MVYLKDTNNLLNSLENTHKLLIDEANYLKQTLEKRDKTIKKLKQNKKDKVKKLKSYLENYTYDTENQEEKEEVELKIEVVNDIYGKIELLWNEEE